MSKGYNPTINTSTLMMHLKKDAEEFKIDIFNTSDNFFEADVDKYNTTYNSLLHNRVFRAATHALRFHAKEFDRIKKTLDSILYEYVSGGHNIFNHLIIPGTTADRVFVFPALPLNNPTYDRLGCVSWCTRLDVLKDFYITLTDQLQDEHKAQGWAPFKRALKRIWKSEEISIERALTRYTTLAKHCSAAQIRDIAASYIETITPPALQFTNAPEDFVKMYGDGPASCMSNAKGVDGAWKILFRRGLSPMSFYGYSPYVKGAYIMTAKGTVAARTICFLNENNTWVHGRMYYATEKNRAQLLSALSLHNIRPLVEGADLTNKEALKGINWDRSYSFEIPGIPTEGIDIGGAGKDVYAMPLPYIDNHSRNLYVTFDKITKKFIVNVNSDMATNVEGQTTIGYTLSSRLEVMACDACGTRVLSTKAIFSQDGICVFCSKGCVNAGNYVYAYRDDGSLVVMAKDLVIEDAYARGEYYTNLNVATMRGVLPYISSVFDLPEEGAELYTAHRGYIVRINTEYYRLDKDELSRLLERKVMKSERHARYGEVYAMDIASSTAATGSNDIDIRKARVVVIEEDFTPIDRREINNILNVL